MKNERLLTAAENALHVLRIRHGYTLDHPLYCELVEAIALESPTVPTWLSGILGDYERKFGRRILRAVENDGHCQTQNHHPEGSTVMKMKLAFGVGLFALSSLHAQAAELGDFLTVGIVASNAADYLTTRAALRNPRIGETNPFARSLLRREPLGIGLKAGATVGEILVVRRLLTNPGHRRLGIVVAVAVIGANTWLAIHNEQIRRRFR